MLTTVPFPVMQIACKSIQATNSDTASRCTRTLKTLMIFHGNLKWSKKGEADDITNFCSFTASVLFAYILFKIIYNWFCQFNTKLVTFSLFCIGIVVGEQNLSRVTTWNFLAPYTSFEKIHKFGNERKIYTLQSICNPIYSWANRVGKGLQLLGLLARIDSGQCYAPSVFERAGDVLCRRRNEATKVCLIRI